MIFVVLTGLVIWLLRFGVTAQVAVLFHTAAGLVVLIPLSLWLLRHWIATRKAARSASKLSAYVGFWVLAGMAGTGYVAARYVWPTKEGESTGGEREVTFPAAQLAEADMVKVLVEGKPVGVFRAADGVHALSLVCTHLGCLVNWNPDAGLMICPCHGSRYEPSGQVVQGPAPLPLKAYDVRVSGDTVVVG